MPNADRRTGGRWPRVRVAPTRRFAPPPPRIFSIVWSLGGALLLGGALAAFFEPAPLVAAKVAAPKARVVPACVEPPCAIEPRLGAGVRAALAHAAVLEREGRPDEACAALDEAFALARQVNDARALAVEKDAIRARVRRALDAAKTDEDVAALAAHAPAGLDADVARARARLAPAY